MSANKEKPVLPDGIVAIVKRECPTCELVAPVLVELSHRVSLTVYTQDDPAFPDGVDAVDDTSLELSWHYGIDSVPTLLRVEDGVETARLEGWQREDWEAFTGQGGLGPELPAWRPGCGSMSVDPSRVHVLAARYGSSVLHSRRIEVAAAEDEIEAFYARGWTDGLPVVPPTEARVMAMLEGTTRGPREIVAVVPPDLVEIDVEKVAINAVMAGCRPEYLPVVLAAVEAACTDEFNVHGVLATTMPVGPVIVVNGPIRRAIGMNSGVNVFGQGNRANATIGRAVQLVIRNVGGGRPGEVDRATHGNPGKLGFCFAEDEEGSPWGPLCADLPGSPVVADGGAGEGGAAGSREGRSTVTLFAGEGPRCIVDQLSRDPDSLTQTYASCLRTLHHPKLALIFDCMLAIGPEHSRVFRQAGWSKERLLGRLGELLTASGDEIVRGASGMAEGMPDHFAGSAIPKFRPGGLLVVHCGGGAGLFSEMIGGWASGDIGSQPVVREIRP
ncbi:MAG: thioredoxin [Candidatus Krumholzibacteriia bacterium]